MMHDDHGHVEGRRELAHGVLQEEPEGLRDPLEDASGRVDESIKAQQMQECLRENIGTTGVMGDSDELVL